MDAGIFFEAVIFVAADLVNVALAHYKGARPGRVRSFRRNCMFSMTGFLRHAVAVAVIAVLPVPAFADDGFPFGFEMSLDAAPQPGSKRIPTLEIGDNGEARLDLWCKSGKGQFSVAGNTVIFIPGPLQDRDCLPARAQADDDLVAALSEAATWKRRGDLVSFIGSKPLRFRINTN
jgi:hypothetical protein